MRRVRAWAVALLLLLGEVARVQGGEYPPCPISSGVPKFVITYVQPTVTAVVGEFGYVTVRVKNVGTFVGEGRIEVYWGGPDGVRIDVDTVYFALEVGEEKEFMAEFWLRLPVGTQVDTSKGAVKVYNTETGQYDDVKEFSFNLISYYDAPLVDPSLSWISPTYVVGAAGDSASIFVTVYKQFGPGEVDFSIVAHDGVAVASWKYDYPSGAMYTSWVITFKLRGAPGVYTWTVEYYIPARNRGGVLRSFTVQIVGFKVFTYRTVAFRTRPMNVTVTVQSLYVTAKTARLRIWDHAGSVVWEGNVTVPGNAKVNVTVPAVAPAVNGTYRWTAEVYNYDTRRVDSTSSFDVVVLPLAPVFLLAYAPERVRGHVGSFVRVNVTVANCGDLPGAVRVELYDHVGIRVASSELYLKGMEAKGVSLTVPVFYGPGAYYWRVRTVNRKTGAVDDERVVRAKVLYPYPIFSVSVPAEVRGQPSEVVRIVARVENRGEAGRVKLTVLRGTLLGSLVTEVTGAVEEGGEAELPLVLVLPPRPGVYTWRVEAVNLERGWVDDSVTFRVVVEQVAAAAGPPLFPLSWLLLLLLALLAVAVALYLLWRKRKKERGEVVFAVE